MQRKAKPPIEGEHMIMALSMLNSAYDICNLNNSVVYSIRKFKRTYFLLVAAYFSFVIYLGMFIPLQQIQALIFCNNLSEYEKVVLLSRVEKNYIVAGFSLFLVVVLYGLKALLSYTANLALLANKCNPRSVPNLRSKNPIDILPDLLKMKRSVSYEAISCSNELKEQLRIIMKNLNLPPNRYVYSIRDI
ncbi:Multidrug resistance ABC transporter ATP-binding and permease protein [Operophtera brumata]|uniref:Multidrug resistance ABC transporter ATP-binding and permease protein n=1 Tax=Operophtera brumata TaxID=104452 RepID=A0A0L7L1C6_OPEBR|nr:Multidrug resistance ABC transporter ATP-binding and permease protein [Operophtera brumata]